MEIRQCYMRNNDCYKAHQIMTPAGIVVHSTAANNPYISRYVQPDDGILGPNKYNNDWNRSGVNKCVHAFIGKDKNGNVRIYQTLPWNLKCWGCGSGTKGSYNSNYIQFEICEDDLTDPKYFEKAFTLAAELVRYLMVKYNIQINNIVSHNEAHDRGYASNHGDPEHWMKKFGKNMDWFRDKLSGVAPAQPTESIPTVWYSSYNGKSWSKDSKNGDTTGDGINAIRCLMAKIEGKEGKIQARVRVQGGNWLPWADGYNPSDYYNGYAGDGKKKIDGLQMRLIDMPGYEVAYRVCAVGNGDFYDWRYGDTDYAGARGKSIGKIQIKIVKKK